MSKYRGITNIDIKISVYVRQEQTKYFQYLKLQFCAAKSQVNLFQNSFFIEDGNREYKSKKQDHVIIDLLIKFRNICKYSFKQKSMSLVVIENDFC